MPLNVPQVSTLKDHYEATQSIKAQISATLVVLYSNAKLTFQKQRQHFTATRLPRPKGENLMQTLSIRNRPYVVTKATLVDVWFTSTGVTSPRNTIVLESLSHF